jgi:hypothetical protein
MQKDLFVAEGWWSNKKYISNLIQEIEKSPFCFATG